MEKFVELSKKIAHALRHEPWKYELEIDQEGWVSTDQLLDALHCEEKWKNIVEADLAEMMAEAEKQRYEMKDGRIRALYGHSFSLRILKEERMPPDILYHGTARRFLPSINENGLLPQKRQYVHLSLDPETAKEVGKRHDGKPCILMIDAKRAWNDGIKFYYGNEKVWLADEIPPRYFERLG